MNKKICIINTGGTITMQSSQQGYQPSDAPIEQYYKNATNHFPPNEVPEVDVISLPSIMDSANMKSDSWNQIAEIILAKNEKYHGFVVLHGTDTMAYTASALSFMLAGLAKPVILTGALLPITNVLTDAWENMRLSVLLAARNEIAEVCVFFHRQLLRGNRSTKLKANGYGAFVSPNYPVLAKVATQAEFKVDAMRVKTLKALKLTRIKTQLKLNIIYFYPGITADIIRQNAKGADAVILNTFGSGNAPIGDPSLYDAIADVAKSCSIVVNHLQCTYGRVTDVYETSSSLFQLGIISGGDMTLEALITKLYYLSSCYQNDFDQIKAMLGENLSGELTV